MTESLDPSRQAIQARLLVIKTKITVYDSLRKVQCDQLAKLKEECPHPQAEVRYYAGWSKHECPDCSKQWIEDLSCPQ